MQRPWLSWSRQRFAGTLLPALACLVVVRIVLVRATESQAVEVAIQGVFILISGVGLYVLLTWAAEHDRRHPRAHDE